MKFSEVATTVLLSSTAWGQSNKIVKDVVIVTDMSHSVTGLIPDIDEYKDALKDLAREAFLINSAVALYSFVDKPVENFGRPRSGDYCWSRTAELGDPEHVVIDAIDNLRFHSGKDWKENQLDGLFRALTLSKWSSDELRKIFLLTDAGYHVEGDFPHASARYNTYAPDDLEGENAIGDWTEICTTEDYPNVEIVVAAAQVSGVSIVVFVTADVLEIYEELCDYFHAKRVECEVHILAEPKSLGVEAMRIIKRQEKVIKKLHHK